MGIEDRYRRQLACPPPKGGRNVHLLGVVSNAVRCGFSVEQAVQEIGEAWGYSAGEYGEIRHAYQSALKKGAHPFETNRPQKPWLPPAKKPPPKIGDGARGFVERRIMQGKGATSGTLMGCSPIPVPAGPSDQTRLFLMEMFGSSDRVYIGQQAEKGALDMNIRTAEEWHLLTHSRELAPLVMGNPLTGIEGRTKEGKPSYRSASCVARFRYALVEFDSMPLAEQCEFWAGVIKSDTLPLRSLTYSGGKSIHGLIELNSKDEAEWERHITELLFIVSNPAAKPEHRADAACKDPNRLTRLPGAMRYDKGKRQSLLWLSPEA
ncbi:MAG: hypothetical protein WCJ02_14740 [bacterium]